MELRKRRIEKDSDLSRKHTVLNKKPKRRIEKPRKENQQIIAGAVSNGLSTTVYRTTMVKFLFSRGSRRDLTVPPFVSLHRNVLMLAVALIST
jgi:hypothetical protein